MIRILSVLFGLLSLFHTVPAEPAGSADTRAVPVLMYHSVSSVHTNDYVLHPDKFDADMKYLTDHGYEAVFPSELTAFCEQGGDLPEKPVVVTFDDGFYNNLSNVLPVAQKYGIKCELNVVGKYVEPEEDCDRSNCYSYLNAKEIVKLRESGLFEIGNHSYDMHRTDRRRGVSARPGEDPASYERALSEDSEKCRKKLLEECNLEVKTFALPYGYYSKDTVKILGKLGYRWVLTCEEGVSKVTRGETGVHKLKRYNRPNRLTSEQYFKRVGIK